MAKVIFRAWAVALNYAQWQLSNVQGEGEGQQLPGLPHRAVLTQGAWWGGLDTEGLTNSFHWEQQEKEGGLGRKHLLQTQMGLSFHPEAPPRSW